MKKALILSAALVALSATLAAAQGINLSLNDCGTFGLTNAPTNACNSNTGAALQMVGSVVPPGDVPQMVACEAVLDGQTNQATLSPWWSLDGCRSGAMTLGADFTTSSGDCADFWAGQGIIVGGIDPTHSAPNRFRIKLTCAVPASQDMAPGSEYYMFHCNILKTKTTGTGNCAGCTDACSIVLNEIRLDQPAGVGDFRIFNPANSAVCNYNGGAGGYQATPTANRTWGQVKALYR